MFSATCKAISRGDRRRVLASSKSQISEFSAGRCLHREPLQLHSEVLGDELPHVLFGFFNALE